MSLRAGFARIDLTPPVGGTDLDIPLLGFWFERAKRFESVHDPLYARAMVLDNGKTRVAIVSCDSIGDAVGYGDQARETIAHELGIPSDHTVVLATHSHTTPETIDLCFEPIDQRWLDEMSQRVAAAVKLAAENLQPAVLRLGGSLVTGVSRYRRPDARPTDYAGRLGSVQIDAGPIDPELWVLYVESSDGCPLGALVNFACHPVCVQTMPMVSADYPGVAMGAIEAEYGGEFVAMFANGATGNTNPVRIKSVEAMRWQGEQLAGAAMGVIHAVRGGDGMELADRLVAAGETVSIPRRTDMPPLERVRTELAARQALCDARGPAGRADRDFAPARELFDLSNFEAVHVRPAETAVAVAVVGCGPWRLVGVGGELFCELGMAIKQALSEYVVMVAGYANGYVGYIANERAFDAGGYEVRPAPWSLLPRGAGERIRDRAVGLARRAS